MSGVSTIQIPANATNLLIDTRPAVSKLLQLPSVIANPGRVLMIKDFYGTAGNNSFTISTTGTDYIEDVIRSYTFSNSFGSVNLLSDGATSWRFIGSYDGTATSTMNVVNKGVMASTIPTSAFVVQLDVTSTIKTVTLPVVSTNPGRMLIIKDSYGKSGASTIVLSTVGSDRFEMSSCSTFILSQAYGSWTLLNDAVNTWYLSEFYRNTLTIASGPITLGGGFSLMSLTSQMVAWFDGADATTVTGTTSVTQWSDKSGKGRHATQTNAGYYPSYANSNMAFLNSATMLYLNNMPANTAGQSFIFVGKPLSTAYSWRTLLRGANADHNLIIYAGGTQIGRYANNNNGFIQFDSYVTDGTGNQTILFYVAIDSSDIYSGSLNGDSNLNTASGALANDNFYCFGNYQGGGQQFGYVSEMVMFSNNLTLSVRQQVEGYLAWKWGIQTNLPSYHPYKNAAP